MERLRYIGTDVPLSNNGKKWVLGPGEIAQKILATQAWKTEFYWHLYEKPSKVHTCNPNAGQEEIGGFLRLTGQTV